MTRKADFSTAVNVVSQQVRVVIDGATYTVAASDAKAMGEALIEAAAIASGESKPD